MPYNPSPQVRAAGEFAKRFGADKVIIYYTLSSGEYGYASYGRDGKLCKQAERIAESVWDEMGRAIAAEEGTAT
jgi:hypothetical protein